MLTSLDLRLLVLVLDELLEFAVITRSQARKLFAGDVDGAVGVIHCGGKNGDWKIVTVLIRRRWNRKRALFVCAGSNAMRGSARSVKYFFSNFENESRELERPQPWQLPPTFSLPK